MLPPSSLLPASPSFAGPPFASPPFASPRPERPILGGISKLFNNPRHADIKIYIGKYEMPAHSVVLATQSKFFEKALSENFKEGKDKEIHFKEGSAQAYWRVFQYMYTGGYSEKPAGDLDAQDDDALLKHLRVYATAEFFMLDDLKELALPRFKAKLNKLWNSDRLADCIREVYKSTPMSDFKLRNAVIDIAFQHGGVLWGRDSFRGLIAEGGRFAVHLMDRFITEKYQPFHVYNIRERLADI